MSQGSRIWLIFRAVCRPPPQTLVPNLAQPYPSRIARHDERPDASAGNCACGSVPVVRSDAATVTFDDSACPLTLVPVGTYPGTIGEPVKTGEAVSARVAPLPEVPYDVPQADPVELGIPAPGYTILPPPEGKHDAPLDS